MKYLDKHANLLYLVPLLVLVLTSFLPPQAFADATVEPHYTHCCLPHWMAHNPIPTSITGMVDSYEISVSNQRNTTAIQVEVFVPSGFSLINASGNESGWTTTKLYDATGAINAVNWTGRTVPAGGVASFTLTLKNPDVGLQFSQVYTFLILQKYQGGAYDAWREPVEIIEPIRILGIDSPLLAFAGIAVALVLPFVEMAVSRTRMRNQEAKGN